MSNIFISYAHEDQERVRPVVKELEKCGWRVFWDRKIPPGKHWRVYLKEKLDESSCVLVVWSQDSIKSKWIQAEADAAEKRDILVPLFIDDVEPPFGFTHIQAADLSDWKNNSSHPAFQELITAIKSILSKPKDPLPKPDPQTTGGDHKNLLSKKKLQQTVIVLASLFVVIFGVIWIMSQPSLPPKQNPQVDTSVSPSAEVEQAKQEAVVRRETEAVKPRQAADALRKAEEAEKASAARRKAEAKKTLNIGDEYGGGKIAWLDASGQHGLIAAKADIPGPYFTLEDATAKCAALGDKWHLPTKDELNTLYHVKKIVGGFDLSYYWSSTEYGANNAWDQHFDNGAQDFSHKASALRVRAVRAF